MVESALPVKTEAKKEGAAAAPATWHPLDNLHREIDRLFEDFDRGGWLRPFRRASAGLEPLLRREFGFGTPAVDIAEKDTAFEITAELPGIGPKDIDVSMKNGKLVIRGEKKDEKEEKTKDYYVRERQYGSFERSFTVPDGVDPSAVEATFSNGILTVTLPKTLAAQKPTKKIDVKAA